MLLSTNRRFQLLPRPICHVSTCFSFWQATLLLLFNGTDRLSYPDIATQLSLPDDDVKPLLYSLSCAAYKILDKVPANGTVSRHDVFEVNSKFTDENNIIKVFPIATVFFLLLTSNIAYLPCC